MSNSLLQRSLFGASGFVVVGTATFYSYHLYSAASDDKFRGTKHYHESKAVLSPNRIEVFQRIAAKYDDAISNEETSMGLPLIRRSLLYFHSKGTVLEVGAGTGRNINYYPNTVDKVVLTDINDKMLFEARKKVRSLSLEDQKKFQLFVSDATNMKRYYDNDSFDTVVDTFGLCSFDDPVAVLKELQRVCKPNGKILLLEHGRSKTWKTITNYLDKNAVRHAANWGSVYNRDLDQIIEDSGLDVENKLNFHFGTTYYLVCKPSKKVKSEYTF